MTDERSRDPSVVPTQHHNPEPDTETRSVVLVLTGDGKGKSSSAFGTLLRGVARGWRCEVVQFIKSGDWRVGEEKVLTDIGVAWRSIGDGFSWDAEDLEVSKGLANDAWAVAREKLASGEVDVLLLDEITYPMNWGWIDTEEVVAAVRDRAPNTYVILTGRDAPAALVELADTVSEVRNVKHAYDRGILARRGFDY